MNDQQSFLKFTKGNSYLPKGTWTLNLPSGYTCPGAKDCLAFADRKTGKITNGQHQKYRCYSATMERYPAVRAVGWHNFDLLRKFNHYEDSKRDVLIANLILLSLPDKAKFIRIHTSGDFFSQSYFDAWMIVARSRPDITFWAFTKSVHFWTMSKWTAPSNYTLQASLGGEYDNLAHIRPFKTARVVESLDEAKKLGLPVDDNDRLAMTGTASFALILNQNKKKQAPLHQ